MSNNRNYSERDGMNNPAYFYSNSYNHGQYYAPPGGHFYNQPPPGVPTGGMPMGLPMGPHTGPVFYYALGPGPPNSQVMDNAALVASGGLQLDNGQGQVTQMAGYGDQNYQHPQRGRGYTAINSSVGSQRGRGSSGRKWNDERRQGDNRYNDRTYEGRNGDRRQRNVEETGASSSSSNRQTRYSDKQNYRDDNRSHSALESRGRHSDHRQYSGGGNRHYQDDGSSRNATYYDRGRGQRSYRGQQGERNFWNREHRQMDDKNDHFLAGNRQNRPYKVKSNGKVESKSVDDDHIDEFDDNALPQSGNIKNVYKSDKSDRSNQKWKPKAFSNDGYGEGRNKLSSMDQQGKGDYSESGQEKLCDRPPQRKKQAPVVVRTLSGKVDESQRGVLIEQLTLGTYECMVCCETVRAQSAIWNCTGCYHVFHLRCIKKWARSPTAVVEGDVFGWRCPACQNTCNKFPNQYRCFCGKLRDPEWNRMETPHSCGEVCKKSRGDKCVHSCNILCHPGPCPTCNALVKRSCACGNISQTMKCGVVEILRCDKVCDKQLNCGKHKCVAKCHDGPCSPCEEMVVQECFGAHEKRKVLCGSRESFTDSYSCGSICQHNLDCDIHTCNKLCHPGKCDTCQLLPSNVTHCPCGATPLEELTAEPRKQCTDPVPTCDRICAKVLSCGPRDNHHTCSLKCHEGECGPCGGETSITCRCGAIQRDIPCQEAIKYTDTNQFCCDKRCSKKKSCGKHKCGQCCCVAEEHPCDQICAKKLSCGLHKCDEVCHRSNCPPCLLSSFDELYCHCGSEVMYPPIPCGTRPPECHRPCVRQHPCEHKVLHNCHSEEECPPCVVLTEKWCMGKHQLRKNIPCHLADISCGLPCDKRLPCGQHKCQKVCHKGPCLDEGVECKQPCLLKRKECDHICGAPCHSESECPALPCKAQITIRCPCGNKAAKVQCMLGGNSATDITEFQKITMQNFAGSTQGQSVDLAQFTGVKKGAKRQLECDADCSVLERNRRVALALEIRNPDLNAKLGNPVYTDFLKDFAKSNPHFVASIEKTLADLVQNAKQSKHPSRSHAFSSMNMNHRRVVHELAEFYGCQTQSYDAEPNKNVVATAVKEKCWLPSVTLTSLVQREIHPKAPVPIPHVYNESTLRQTAEAAKLSTDVLGQEQYTKTKPDTSKSQTAKSSKPAIDYFDFSEN